MIKEKILSKYFGIDIKEGEKILLLIRTYSNRFIVSFDKIYITLGGR